MPTSLDSSGKNRKGSPTALANLLRTPSPCEPFDREVVKFPICHELRLPRPCRAPQRGFLGTEGVISAGPWQVTRQLPANG